jgi:hypothetical protein
MWTLYPGFDFRGLEYLVKERDYRSIVLQLYGSLSAPTGTDDVDCAMFVAWCKERDVTVIGCPHEPPLGNLLDYESTISLRESGMIIVPHTLPEVAYVKAVCLGSVAGDRDDLVERFLTPLAAEFYENHA